MYLLKSIDHYNEAFIRVSVSLTPLSSTHQLHKGATPFQPQNPSVQHKKPLSSTTLPLLSSTPKTPLFHTTPSSTLKTPQFNTALRQKNSSI